MTTSEEYDVYGNMCCPLGAGGTLGCTCAPDCQCECTGCWCCEADDGEGAQ